ncbi:hypothetical protein EHRUM4_05080 [Ehrlichia ruminantium]|uniref:Uncharacterized protein n=1 Tax=Ehrlichia ruminantium TaxID=779 RepID=A0A170RVR6_EHRRU|nr:hypothetical protein EHRUM4_05080 [Ehrlichia ruminantium]GAT77286.1 hypothetical protein EHRUM2_05040 [Ehrlichia ruminantium]GAT78379.1 hypothetical protein EHRUM3_05990 [Ehrlichia ruminantium]
MYNVRLTYISLLVEFRFSLLNNKLFNIVKLALHASYILDIIFLRNIYIVQEYTACFLY